jgi:hypothetical protein
MSLVSPDGVGIPASSHAIEGIIRECEAMKGALARARMLRLLLLAALATFVAIAVWMFYDLGMKLQGEENLKRIETLAKQRLSGNSDEYMKEVQLLVDHSSPVVTQAFSAQVKKDLPGYLQALEKERDQFAEELLEQFWLRLDRHYRAAMAKHIALMEAEYPELKDKQTRERLVDNMAAASKTLVRKYYVEELQGQMTALYDGWDHFPAATPAVGGEAPLEDQFIATLLELLTYKLSHGEPGSRP